MKISERLTQHGSNIYHTLLKGGYAKGYGPSMIRIMDKDHNPIFNCPKSNLDFLVDNGHAVKDGFIWKLGPCVLK